MNALGARNPADYAGGLTSFGGRGLLVFGMLLLTSAVACSTITPRPTGGSAPVSPNQAVGETRPAVPAQAIIRPPGTQPSESGLTVYGESIVRTDPDLATVTIGVQTTGKTAREAQDANTPLIAAVIARLKTLGTVETDLRTSGANLSPVFNPTQRDRVESYTASNTVVVTIRDIKRVGEYLDAAVTAGANQVQGIQFGLREDNPAKKQALEEAVKGARTKGDIIAGAAGLRIIGFQSLTDESSLGPITMSQDSAPRAAMSAPALRADVPIQAGQLSVMGRVRIVYTVQ